MDEEFIHEMVDDLCKYLDEKFASGDAAFGDVISSFAIVTKKLVDTFKLNPHSVLALFTDVFRSCKFGRTDRDKSAEELIDEITRKILRHHE